MKKFSQKLFISLLILNLFRLNKSKNVETPNKLLLIFNPNTKIQSAANLTTSKASDLDWSRNLSALYNGKTGDAFIFNYEKGEGVYIREGSTKKTWYSSEISYQDYFKNVRQDELWKFGITHGIKFDPSSVTEEISDKIGEILQDLSSDFSSRCEALATFLQVSRVSAEYLKTSMSAYLQVMGEAQTSLRSDLKGLIGTFNGMGEFYQDFPRGMEMLAKKNVRLDLSKIFTAPTGIHVLIYFLEELKPNFDVGKFLAHTLNNEMKFFKLVNKLTGQTSHGFDGFFNVITEIIQYIYEENSIENVDMALMQYYENLEPGDDSIRQKWTSFIKELVEKIDELKLNKSFDKLVELLENILKNEWFVKNTNMSLVTEIIFETTNFIESSKKIHSLL